MRLEPTVRAREVLRKAHPRIESNRPRQGAHAGPELSVPGGAGFWPAATFLMVFIHILRDIASTCQV